MISDNKWTEENASRRAKWWYSTFHCVTAMIGAGVLSLPNAMAYLGWYITLIISTLLDKYKFNL